MATEPSYTRRIESIEQRLSKLERFGNVITSTQLLTTFSGAGKPIVQVGEQSDDLNGIRINDDTGVLRMKLGELSSTGRAGMEVYSTDGATVELRAGQLAEHTGSGVECRTSTGGYVKLANYFVPAISEVDPTQATSSTSFTDLATAGPSVTVNVGPTGKVLLQGGGFTRALVTNQTAVIGLSVDAGAAATWAAVQNNGGDGVIGASVARGDLITGLSSGDHTFTFKYRQTLAGSSADFAVRWLVATPY